MRKCAVDLILTIFSPSAAMSVFAVAVVGMNSKSKSEVKGLGVMVNVEKLLLLVYLNGEQSSEVPESERFDMGSISRKTPHLPTIDRKSEQ